MTENTKATEVRGRSGLAAIVGRPNAGKSTLINRLVGQKIAIVTAKPQTTRNRIQGIVTRAEGQIVFIDTPGLYDADSALGRQMMHEVAAALEDIDVLLLMVDASHPQTHMDELLLSKAKRFRGKTILVLNKVDRVAKVALLPLIEEFSKAFEFAAIVPISALQGGGLEQLQQETLRMLPEGPPHFPEDQVTDQPVRFMVAEIVREQVLLATSEEVPYATTVVIDQFEEGKKLTRIAATIHCERDGQKKILVGRQGQMLKKIGTQARLQIEKMVGTRVYLELFVRVSPGWRESHTFIEEMDWRRQPV